MESGIWRQPKILIIGIHGEYEPWLDIFKEGQKKTWMTSTENSMIVNAFGLPIKSKTRVIDEKIYYLRWSSNKIIAYGSLLIEAIVKTIVPLHKLRPCIRYENNYALGDIWRIEMCDTLMLQGVKNIAVFRNALKFKFDYLVTTITSSYLNVPALEAYLSEVKASRFIGGRLEFSGELKYQQGSFRVYSRDIVEDIVFNSRKYRHWKIEDVAMGNLISSFADQLTEIPNRTLATLEEVEMLTQEDLKTVISYRCKATEKGKRIDSRIMRLLHQKIISAK